MDNCLNYVYTYLLPSHLVGGGVVEVDCLSSDFLFVVIHWSIIVQTATVIFQIIVFFAFLWPQQTHHTLYCWIRFCMNTTWWADKAFGANFFSIWVCLQNVLESTLNTSCWPCVVHFYIYQYIVSYLNENWT